LAQNLVEENKKLQGSLGQGQQALLEQAKKVVSNEIDKAKSKLKAAHEAFDTDAIVAAQEDLTAAKIRSDRVNNFKPVASTPAPVVQQNPQATVAPPDADALAWQQTNQWFGKDRRMTAVALEIHQELAERGVKVGSQEYYHKIDTELRGTFPGAFTQEERDEKSRRSNIVAPATRGTAPKKIVLTQSQVNLAKRLGLSNQQYARAVAEEMRKQNG
jgi:DNA-binding transcriptional regulator YbjK